MKSKSTEVGPVGPLVGRRVEAAWPVAGSIAAHVLLIGLALGLSGASENPLELMQQKPVVARLVRLGTPRDPALLPRKEELPPPPPPPPPQAIPLPGVAPTPSTAPAEKNPPVKSNTAEEDRAKARSRLFDAFAKSSAKPGPVYGSPDGDPEGDSESGSEGERYFGVLLSKTRRNYGVTKSIPQEQLKRLKAVVVIYIDAQGRLLRDPQIQKSSGNSLFDSDVLMALRKAAPFGPPPPHLLQSLKTVGVAIEATP